MDTSRGRSRLGSHRRASCPIRGRVCIQAHEVAGERDEGAPDLILGEVVQREVGQAGVLGGADAVLGAGPAAG